MITYEVRQLDCWINADAVEEKTTNDLDMYDWYVNSSYRIGTFSTSAKNEKKALSNYLRRNDIRFFGNKVRYIYDISDECIYIVCRSDYEPLFVAIPVTD